MTSRNAREGRYIGRWEGKPVRTLLPQFFGMVDADLAWACMSKRIGTPLPLRRPRYITKKDRL